MKRGQQNDNWRTVSNVTQKAAIDVMKNFSPDNPEEQKAKDILREVFGSHNLVYPEMSYNAITDELAKKNCTETEKKVYCNSHMMDKENILHKIFNIAGYLNMLDDIEIKISSDLDKALRLILTEDECKKIDENSLFSPAIKKG